LLLLCMRHPSMSRIDDAKGGHYFEKTFLEYCLYVPCALATELIKLLILQSIHYMVILALATMRQK